MKQQFLTGLQITLFLVVLICLVSLMVLFIGGGQSTADLEALFAAQLVAIPIGLVTAALSLVGTRLATLWRALPQWLVFIVLLLNALALCGEIALVVAARMTSRVGPWQEHVPLVCMIVCSVAFLLLYSRQRLDPDNKPALSGRW